MRSHINRIGKWLVLLYWLTAILVYLVTDFYVEMYTFTESGKLAGRVSLILLPLAVYSVMVTLPLLQWRWYGNLFIALVIGGIYLWSGYSAAKKIDLLWSAATRPVTGQRLIVKAVTKVVAGRAGFIHTDVKVLCRQKTILFETSRSNYFSLKDKKLMTVDVGQSVLNEYFVRDLQIPADERWHSRKLYWQDWVARYSWLGLFVIIYIAWLFIKEKIWR